MPVLIISKFEYVIAISLLVVERKGFTIFNPNDLWPRSSNDLDLLNSWELKLTAFPHHRVQHNRISIFLCLTLL